MISYNSSNTIIAFISKRTKIIPTKLNHPNYCKDLELPSDSKREKNDRQEPTDGMDNVNSFDEDSRLRYYFDA